MLRQLIQNEKLLFASIGANGALEYVRHLLVKFQPEMTALLTVLQIAVAVLTLAHLVRKFLTHRKK